MSDRVGGEARSVARKGRKTGSPWAESDPEEEEGVRRGEMNERTWVRTSDGTGVGECLEGE